MLIPGYTIIEDVHRGRRRLLLRARRERDGAMVLLRTFPDEPPTAQEVAALRREAELLGSLALPGLTVAPGLVNLSDRQALALSDPGGTTLKRLIAGRGVDVGRFLRLAVGLADTAAILHRHGLVHLALSPSAFMVDASGARPILIAGPVDARSKTGNGELDDGLAYVSPEQTGRTSRAADARSDLYTLGITFFEMLTGQVPFDGADQLELVHAHLARRPPSLRTLVPDLPPRLEAMVQRLLAKSPEQRYPNAAALRADLDDCLAAWERTGRLEPMQGGDAGPRDRLEIPGRLYGRDEEVERLRAALTRAAGGAVELVMVSGYAGIGKTALIRELADPATRPGWYLASGKFDQIVRVPYGAFIQAFRGLLQQLLGEDERRLTQWRERLASSLGAGAAVLAEVVPEIELLLGRQPPPAALAPSEARNRFRQTVQRFVHALGRTEHALVLVLDDLQWADSATLDLLEPLLTGPEAGHLLVIGAYRDNEVDAAHPLTRTLTDLESAGIRLRRIQLGPLALPDLTRLLADTLEGDPGVQAPLAKLVLEKTGGNPFFVIQFLHALQQSALVTFDYERRVWTFDLETIARAGMTDNVIDLMARKIQRLSPKARDALTLGACIGNRFDLSTLAIVSRQSTEDAAADLDEAVREGLLLAAAGPDQAQGYEFLHDRVQLAAYSAIPDGRKHLVHLTVGRLLRERWLPSTGEERLFDVAHHLNLGRRLIEAADERLALARLDLSAARRAKASTAYQAARTYLQAARDLLPPHAWDTEYDLTLAIHLEAAECEYVTGDDAEAERLVAALLARARSRVDLARVHRLRIVHYEYLTWYADAIAVGREALALFGLSFPDDAAAKAAAVEGAIADLERALGGRPIASLIDLPVLADPEIKALMVLLAALHTPCYLVGDKALTLLNTATMVRLSLIHGNTEESALAYVFYAMYVGPIREDFAAAYEFGQLALKLHERLPDPGLHARVLMNFSWAVSIWRRPFAESFRYTRDAVRLANETGQFPDAGYALFNECYLGLLSGPELETVAPACDANVAYLRRVKMQGFVDGPAVIRQWALALQGRTRHPTSLDGGDFDETKFLEAHRGESLFEMFYQAAKLALLCTFGQHAEAAALGAEAEGPIREYTGTIWDALRVFHHALALCGRYGAPGAGRDTLDATLDGYQARLARWAENAPDNFEAMHHIVAAEIARVRNRHADAIERYEAAIEAAARRPCPRERALASELFGRFWLARGQAKVAAAYLGDAQVAYLEWGAAAKAAALEEAQRGLLPPATRPMDGSSGAPATAIDLASVMKAARALAGEMELESLLGTLLRLTLENTGAERGALVLERDGEAWVRAYGAVESARVMADGAERLADFPRLPQRVINYVRRSGEWLVLPDACGDPRFATDPYVQAERPRSVLCAPVVNQGRLVGVLYAENNLAPGAFTAERLEVTQVLASHAAIAITNAELFAEVVQLRDRLQAENVYLLEEVREHRGFEEMVGESAALERVLRQVEQVAPTDSTVLITGETGTGKELIARAIHNLSRRADHPLVPVNCGAISPGLVESELFGHEKGAFTGASSRRIGRFELADGGTVFLDEIGDLAPDLQVKLLRVLQEGEIERVGGSRAIAVNVRVLAATHRDLGRAVEDGQFRADLYYRLNVFPVRVPPLRERTEDIPALVRHFVMKYAAKMGKRIDSIPTSVLDALVASPWPGNVRELANVIERSVILSQSTRLELGEGAGTIARPEAAPAGPRTGHTTREDILEALRASGWRVSGPKGAAQRLGLKPTTLEARMKKLGITRSGLESQRL